MIKRLRLRVVSLWLVLTLLLVGMPLPQPTAAQDAVSAPMPTAEIPESVAPPAPDYGQMPLLFVENRGQVDAQVAYYLFGGDKEVYFTPQGVTFALSQGGEERMKNGETENREERVSSILDSLSSTPDSPSSRWAVKLDFVDANPAVQPVGEDPAETVVSYFKGPQSEWRTGLATYHRIVYRDLWPGIDLVYYGAPNQLKYEFVVQPGADPAQIRLAYRGATSVTRTPDGQLEIATPLGSFRDGAPVAYQEVAGKRTPVAMAYALEAKDEGRRQKAEDASSRILQPSAFGFVVGDYDPTRPLILDPAVIIYSGFIGGSGDDIGFDIAVDGAGNAYVTGYTASTDFPATGGPDPTYNDGDDAFVAKVNADGTGLVYAGFIGGSSYDYGEGIAVDDAGNAYVTGITASTDFPATGGPDLTFNGGYNDGFIAKVNAAGTGLVYAGFIGGTGVDAGYRIAVDDAGNAYITGQTASPDFPTIGGQDSTYNGNDDAFVAKVNADGKGLVYAGFLGGSNSDWGSGITVDGVGNVYVTGGTRSTDFPATVGPDMTHNGGDDAFVAKVNADGTELVYAGFIGGSNRDEGRGITVDGAGNAYVTGITASTDFPATVGPDLIHNGGEDAFVVKVNAAGTGLVYASFIGGNTGDVGYGIAVDGAGNTYVTGETESPNFPASGGPALIHNGGECDAFVAKVNAAGTGLVYAGFIGGSSRDGGNGIAVDGAGNAYVTGFTESPNFPVTVGPNLTFNDGDAFVAKIGILTGPISVTLPFSSTSNLPILLTYTDTQQLTTTLLFPVGVVTAATTIILTPTLAQPAGGWTFAGHAFEITAWQGGKPIQPFVPRVPLTLTIHYSAQDVRLVSDVEQLTVHHWTGAAWEDAARTCTPASTYQRDIANRSLSVALCHLSQFALFGPTHAIYLPLILRQSL